MRTLTLKIGIQSLMLLGLSGLALSAHAQTTTLPILFAEPAQTQATTTTHPTSSSTPPKKEPSPAAPATSTAPASSATSTPSTGEETPPLVEEAPVLEEAPIKPEPKPVVKPLVPEKEKEETATSTPILPIAGIFSGPTQFTGIYATEGPLSRETTRTLLQIAFISALLGFLLVEKRMLERTGAVFARAYSRLRISHRTARKA